MQDWKVDMLHRVNYQRMHALMHTGTYIHVIFQMNAGLELSCMHDNLE